jgi:hypothetical protein
MASGSPKENNASMADRSFKKCFNEMELLTMAGLLLNLTPIPVLYDWADAEKIIAAENKDRSSSFFIFGDLYY